MSLIYNQDSDDGHDSSDSEDETEASLDTNRYDVAQEKLQMYKRPAVKRHLKKRFVTGGTQD